MSGRLRIVATPIGNLEDLSPRAGEALREADLVVCEDTRITRKLLSRLDAHPRVVAVHAHNEEREAARIAAEVARGAVVVLVTDAGTPGVSDPGRRIVEACHEAGQRVEPVPGPSAAIAALVASGLPSARFAIEGFLPSTGKARRRRLQALMHEERTQVIFEAPHRLLATLTDLEILFGGDRRVALCREMTKIHEEISVTDLKALRERLEASSVKGECTLVIQGAAEAPDASPDRDELRSMLQEAIRGGETKRDAVARISAQAGVSKRVVFDVATSLEAISPRLQAKSNDEDQ